MNTYNYINLSLQAWGCVISIITMLCIILGNNTKSITNTLYKRMLIFNASSMALDALALIFRGKIGTYPFFIVRFGNMGAYICNYLLTLTFVHYLTEFIGQKTNVSRLPLNITRIITSLSIVTVLFSWYFPIFFSIDSNNMYHRGEYFWVSQIAGVVCLFFSFVFVIKYRKYLEKQEKASLWIYIILPIFALIFQIFFYGIAFLNLVNTISLVIVFLFMQARQGQKIAEQARLLAEQETEMTNTRLAVMLSQMQPHFVNNTLNAIYYLCGQNPKLAQNTIKDFATYLRFNIDAMTQTIPIPFYMELRHIETYLNIEKLRFGDDLNIVYDIKANGFMVPTLSVQPIVENAVLHGICQDLDGGTVTISTDETDEYFRIIVDDDGVGFDVKDYNKDGKTHIGITSAESRIKTICNGTFEIKSQIGVGTTATICIPKE